MPKNKCPSEGQKGVSKMKLCPNARPTDEYHGWLCMITDCACEYLIPYAEGCTYLDKEDSEEKSDNNAEI